MFLPYLWIPEGNMVRRVLRDHVPYDVWEEQGFLATTEGDVIHYRFIESFIEDLGKEVHIKEIAFDRWGAVAAIMALDRAVRHGGSTGSVYDERGILSF